MQLSGIAAASTFGFGEDVPVRTERAEEFHRFPTIELRAHQDPGSVVNWVLPGRRTLSRFTFGTPDQPYSLPDHWINVAEPPVADVLREFPLPSGLPLEARAVNEDGTRFTHTTIPTPFSDKYRTTSGSFDITYTNRRLRDRTGKDDPDLPSDDVELSSTFTDPAGNEYELRLQKVIEPLWPNYATGGGVVTTELLHGVTGTGTPLMPRMMAYGAMWSIGKLLINGEVVDKNRVIHFMTTEMVRDSQYHLVTTKDLPLSEDEAYLGYPHHTHGILPPVKITEQGPTYDPVPTAFELPNGQKQPFIHIMYDKDVIDEFVVKQPEAGGAGTRTTTAARQTTTARQTATATQRAQQTTTADVATSFFIGGEVAGWQALQQGPISEGVNPTLNLETGRRYEVTWRNLDGLPHNFAIVDSNGNVLLATDIMSRQGETQTVTFEATERMAEYLCQVHPSSMRGEIAFGGGG